MEIKELLEEMKKGKSKVRNVKTERTGEIVPDPEDPKKPFWYTTDLIAVQIDPLSGKKGVTRDVKIENLEFIN